MQKSSFSPIHYIFSGSNKQSGWENFEKILSKQGRFCVFRVEKNFKIVKRPCFLDRYYRVLDFRSLDIILESTIEEFFLSKIPFVKIAVSIKCVVWPVSS